MKRVWYAIFGARGQLVVGVAALLLSAVAWAYGATLAGEALLRFLYHMSMFYGCVASYAIIATALGYRATERVETAVVERIDHADEVDVG